MATQVKKGQIDDTIVEYGMARQAVINGNFDIWQRGTSVTPADGAVTFQADHWADAISRDGGTLPTLTRSRQSLTVGAIPNSFYFTRLATNGAGTSLGVNSNHYYSHKIEHGTRLLCGLNKKVTISFYAASSIANKRIAVSLLQNYGTGGSPTSQEPIITSAPITLTSTLTKYTITFTTNTLVGKTFGTANDDYLQILIHHEWGTTFGNTYVYPSVTSETYVGSGNIDIAQVQLCAGDVALPFMPKSFEDELRACMRYFEKGSWIIQRQNCDTLRNSIDTVQYRVTKRIAGTAGCTDVSTLNVTTKTFAVSSIYNGTATWRSSSGSDYVWSFDWTVDAEL